jgi:hypothetical protein
MAFSRNHLLLDYGTEPTVSHYAFSVERTQEYDGEQETRPLQVSRNPNGDLLVVYGTSKREFMGAIFLEDDATGTVVYNSVTYTIGTPSNLKTCLAASDLRAKSFDDSSFWNAVSVMPWSPRVEYEHNGTTRIMRIRLLQK